MANGKTRKLSKKDEYGEYEAYAAALRAFNEALVTGSHVKMLDYLRSRPGVKAVKYYVDNSEDMKDINGKYIIDGTISSTSPLPNGVIITGDYILSGAYPKYEPPEDIIVLGDVVLSGSALKWSLKNCVVGGEVDIQDTHITEISYNCMVGKVITSNSKQLRWTDNNTPYNLNKAKGYTVSENKGIVSYKPPREERESVEEICNNVQLFLVRSGMTAQNCYQNVAVCAS